MRTRVFHAIGRLCFTATMLLVLLGRPATTDAADLVGQLNVPGSPADLNLQDEHGTRRPAWEARPLVLPKSLQTPLWKVV